MRTPVSVRRTEVSADFDNGYESSTEKRAVDPDKQCPLHHKPHPLRKCRGFRYTSLDERKACLKDSNICFRCCATTSHQAKDCDKKVQSIECNSDRHPTALHPGPAPWTTGAAITSRYQGEGQNESLPFAVTSKCTDICGTAVRPRSCTKMCLVRVYPAGQRERAVKTYVVLDEQSNKSLAKTEFF